MNLQETVWTETIKAWATRENASVRGAIEAADLITAAFTERFLDKTAELPKVKTTNGRVSF